MIFYKMGKTEKEGKWQGITKAGNFNRKSGWSSGIPILAIPWWVKEGNLELRILFCAVLHSRKWDREVMN